MIKKILYSVAAVVLLLVVGLVILINAVDSKIKEEVEENAAKLTGSEVTVEDVDFSLISGKGSITSLRVSNPEGFSGLPALTLGKILFEVDMDPLSMDIITIQEIKADSTEILLEKNGEGKINFQVLSQNLKKVAEEKDPPDRASDSWIPDLRISEFILSEGKVTLSGFGEDAGNLRTPELKLHNLGGPKGAPPDKVVEEILSGIFSEIIRHSVQSGLQKWIEENTAIPDVLKNLLNQGLGSIN